MSTTKRDKISEEIVHTPEIAPEEDSNETDSIIEDINNLPKEAKQIIKKLEFGMMGVSHLSQENEVAKKINETHITNYLDGAREQMHNAYKERHEKKIFTVILVFLALVFFTAIIVLLKNTPDILEKIIYSVASLIAGAFGGYGLGKRNSQDDD